MLQLVIVEVGGSERHHEVPEADERTVGVSEETDNNVTVEYSHGGLVTVLYHVFLSIKPSFSLIEWKISNLRAESPHLC